jgi:hypothetical protein
MGLTYGKLTPNGANRTLGFHSTTATDPAATPIYTTPTDSTGSYAINLPAGKYRVSVDTCAWVTTPTGGIIQALAGSKKQDLVWAGSCPGEGEVQASSCECGCGCDDDDKGMIIRAFRSTEPAVRKEARRVVGDFNQANMEFVACYDPAFEVDTTPNGGSSDDINADFFLFVWVAPNESLPDIPGWLEEFTI